MGFLVFPLWDPLPGVFGLAYLYLGQSKDLLRFKPVSSKLMQPSQLVSAILPSTRSNEQRETHRRKYWDGRRQGVHAKADLPQSVLAALSRLFDRFFPTRT